MVDTCNSTIENSTFNIESIRIDMSKKLEECKKCGYKWEKNGVLDVDINSDSVVLTKQVTIDIATCPKCVNEEWKDEEKAYLAKLEKLVEEDDES